jgi:hypothetical protein
MTNLSSSMLYSQVYFTSSGLFQNIPKTINPLLIRFNKNITIAKISVETFTLKKKSGIIPM